MEEFEHRQEKRERKMKMKPCQRVDMKPSQTEGGNETLDIRHKFLFRENKQQVDPTVYPSLSGTYTTEYGAAYKEVEVDPRVYH